MIRFAGRILTAVLLFAVVHGMCAVAVEPPDPVPPVHTALKDLCLTTDLVRDGRPSAVIVAPASGIYNTAAVRIRDAVSAKTGVSLSIVGDTSPEAAVPFARNIIVLGNRSTNEAMSELYNRWFTVLDLRYPGPGGSVVRTLHNPFGNRANAVLIGGSDTAGVNAAAGVFAEKIAGADYSGGVLSIGRMAEITLGDVPAPPSNVRDMLIWDASDGYNSTGYFGWNSLSKHLAMYYMTGNEHHAREFLRLAFPDEQAKQEIADIDGELIENKDEPISGPYHYNAHLMILLWDLVEESPVFTDDDRLRITNAFSKQLLHRKIEGVYGITEPPPQLGTRHGQWAAMSLYCLARYFDRDYPDPIWSYSIEACDLYFKPLYKHTWVNGENDNLFWYNTAVAPIFSWLLLTGDRVPLENGVLRDIARNFEILLSGEPGDANLRYSSIGFLHKAAYLLYDGRFIHYRERTNQDMNAFRLGQSFWPDDDLAPSPPADLIGTWSISRLTEDQWNARKSGLPLGESFHYGSYRSAHDNTGDFLFIDGFNGESRNPYHTFDILRLRLDGVAVLAGYMNQVQTSANGLVPPKIAKDAALRRCGVTGQTVYAVGEVPDASYCSWRRTILQRIGAYALVADELAYRENSDVMRAEFTWESPNTFDKSVPASGIVRLASKQAQSGGRLRAYTIAFNHPSETAIVRGVGQMQWLGPVKRGEHGRFFTLICENGSDPATAPSCVRISDNAAALALPEPAVAVSGRHDATDGDLVVIAGDHLSGVAVSEAGIGGTLVRADSPVDIDWNFTSGELHIMSGSSSALGISLDSATGLTLDGAPVKPTRTADGLTFFAIPAGRHVLAGARPSGRLLADTVSRIGKLLESGRRTRIAEASGSTGGNAPSIPPITAAYSHTVEGSIADIVTIPAKNGDMDICAASGAAVHVLSPVSKKALTMPVTGEIRVLRWWPEPGLIVAGCKNEEVVAFDTGGGKAWTFVSEMDPEVFRAAKTYWFKSAPGHEGIHGLYSGPFIDGESQLFVGSACTLEILDERGALVRRMPQFWGPPSAFAMIEGPGGSKNLLAARHINGVHNAGIINNVTLDPEPRGFDTVPEGHTYVGGWMSLNRHHLFYEDLDGDGVREVVSEINGTWNRVTVWDKDGTALNDVSFGPGDRIPAINMRDLDVADLDGDGTKEVVAATWKGDIVALDCRLDNIWTLNLPSTPTVAQCVENGATGAVVAGCEDGSIYVLDNRGTIVRKGAVNGRPTVIARYSSPGTGAGVVVGTSAGEIAVFALDR